MQKGYQRWKEFTNRMKEKNISAHAASIAFFLFLSLVPMLALLCMIIPYTPLTEANLTAAVTDLVPDALGPLLENLVSEVYDKSKGGLSVAILAVIWSAGKGVLALMRGLNEIADVTENRNYFVVRLMSSFYTIVMLFAVLLFLIIGMVGSDIVGNLLALIPHLKYIYLFIMYFRFVFGWILLTALFGLIYAYVPNRKQKFGEQLNGAMFAAVCWSVFSWGFSLYVGRDGEVGIYGSISIIIILMIFLYFCMYIMLVGAQLNQTFSENSLTFGDKVTKMVSVKSDEGTQ